MNQDIVHSNVQVFHKHLTMNILKSAESNIPKTKPYSKPYVPWWNKNCEIAVRNRKHAYNRVRKTRHPTDIIVFKQTRAITKHTIFKAKTEACRNYSSSFKSNTKLSEVWRTLKQFSLQDSFFSIFENDFENEWQSWKN